MTNQTGQVLAIEVKCYFGNISWVGFRFHVQVSPSLVSYLQLSIELVVGSPGLSISEKLHVDILQLAGNRL